MKRQNDYFNAVTDFQEKLLTFKHMVFKNIVIRTVFTVKLSANVNL